MTLQPNGALRVQIAPALLPMWTQRRRYKGLRGGRGSGKSWGVAERIVVRSATEHIRAACMREIQQSIKDSAKQLIEDKIYQHFGPDQTKFKITDREIVCEETESLMIFRGLQNHTAASIKSLEGFNLAWYEESQTLSERSLELATPTFRSGSEQLFTWNPDDPTDPVDLLFLENLNDPDFLLIDINHYDNPWFPDDLRGDMERDRRRSIDKYRHVWEGDYRRNSEARVFTKVQSFHFDTPRDAFFYHGGDFGFSIDPSVLVRTFTGRLEGNQAIYDPDGKTLFIDAEAYGVGVEIDDTPGLYDGLGGKRGKTLSGGIIVPEASEPGYGAARRWEIRADSARPETISYLRKHGYPLIVSATKGPNSITEGITFLQDYDIVIHPRCKHTLDEFLFYSWKIDKKTSKITNELEEKKNHVIDAVRYAIEPLRRVASTSKSTTTKGLY